MYERLRRDLILYQMAHRNKTNQMLHYFAFLAAFLAWIYLFIDWRVTLVLAFAHYALSWIGHFRFEKNKPAALSYPLVGFYAGFMWFFLKTLEWVTGRKLLPPVHEHEKQNQNGAVRMSKKVKWGILGYARIAKLSVIPAILKSDNAELYALASGDPAKRSECKELFNCPNLYGSYDELLEDPQVQAVYVPLPNSLHKEWAIKAMRKGKHVLCEKPIALNAAECKEMIEASEKYGVLLMEAFMYRYTERIRKLNAILASGEIGELRYVQSTFRFLLNRPNTIKVRAELGGGSLYDVGSYPLNFVGMVTGQMPESCVSECVKENGVDILFSAVLKYPNGVVASINSGFNAFGQMNSEIVGSLGRIEIPDTFLGTEGAITVVTEAGSRQVATGESDRYALEVKDFSDCVLSGRKPLFGLDETYRNMRVMDMLFESMK